MQIRTNWIRRISLLALVAVTLLATAPKSEALPIEDMGIVGGINYFRDTTTGYTWMDVNTFSNMTYAQVQSFLLTGPYSNFHLANVTELFGVVTAVRQIRTDTAADMLAMGGVPGQSLQGYYNDSYFNNYTNWIGTASLYLDGGLSYGGFNSAYITDVIRPNWGAFVVSTAPFSNPVPEPGTIVLLGSGLLGFIGFRLRKR